jgi:hypothetical protein
MPAPPDPAFLARKVGQTFLSGARKQFFNRLLGLREWIKRPENGGRKPTILADWVQSWSRPLGGD